MRSLSLLILIYDAIAEETFVPRTLVETDDIPLNGEDSTDAGAALVKSGAYAELRQAAQTTSATSVSYTHLTLPTILLV